MKKRYGTIVICLLILTMIFTGCNANTSQAAEKADGQTAEGKVKVKYTNRDIQGTYDQSEAVDVALENESYTINEAGVYIFSGSLEDGQIIVDAADEDKVQIVLNGVDIHCSNGPAIYVKNANKTFITLAKNTENKLSDGTAYTSTEDEPWGAIFSKDDLTINGSGELSVEGNYKNGIVSKDDLRITGGSLTISAAYDGIRGRNSVGVYNGTLNITAEQDGIQSNHDEDETKGYVSIDGGEVNITCTSGQGIDAYQIAQITGGTVQIESGNEGIQAKVVYISNGKIEVDAEDDCLNGTDSAAEKSENAQEGTLLEITGGTIYLNSKSGDCLDSNGDILISGGEVCMTGPASGVEANIDYNGDAQITGGTVLGTGTGQMAQNFGETSTQGSIFYSADTQSQGAYISLMDSDGEEIISFTAEEDFSAVMISSPEIKQGETYTLKIGDTEKTINMDTLIVSEGNSSRGAQPPGQMGQGPGMGGGQKPA